MSRKGKGRGDDLKQEEILQAVLVADSFNVRFGPITEKKPRALLPLLNVPMLAHILDYLAAEGVQETFLFCSHLSSDIRKYIEGSKWREGGATSMTVKVILAMGSHSLGDGLRELDRRSLVRNDFFLLNCDTFTNANLKDLMTQHRALRAKIKSAVMTMTCMKCHPQDRIRCAEDNILLGTHPDTHQVCEYQKVALDKKIKINLFKNPDMVVHQDLLDGQLYICSPMFLNLFTDNFDYGTLDDFIHGVIINEEVFGNTIHTNVLRKNQYCARVTNPYMYDIISQDILSRKLQPINPETMNASIGEDIQCHVRNIYHDSDHVLPSKVILKRNVLIGSGSTLQPEAVIEHTVIGRNCTIGAGVKMQNCYLWDNVTVQDGCELSHAILCDGVTVFANTVVQPQTILSWNVKVGPDVRLPPGIRLQDTPPVDEFADDDEEEVPEVMPEYGAKSKAFLYTVFSEDSDDDGDQFTADWGEPVIGPGSDDDDDSSSASAIEPLDLGEEVDEDMDEKFYSEVMETLRRAKEENIKLDHLILEVNSLKHAFNIAIKDVQQAVVKALVDLPLRQKEEATGKELVKAVLQHVSSRHGLLKNYIKNSEAQMEALHALEDFAVENDRMLSVLSHVVHYLYDKDVLEEAVINRWYDIEADEEEEEEHGKIRKQMENFVTWLREAEEEESSEDD